jgi:hypothetical protein
MKSPIGKYFKTRNEKIYCYAFDGLMKYTYECICVGDNYIRTMYYNHIESFPKSTKKGFVKAYNRTIEKFNRIVDD